MSSGQVSMLLSSVNTVGSGSRLANGDNNRLDKADTDSAAGFISSFNAALIKEPSTKPFELQRQVSAAISPLSETNKNSNDQVEQDANAEVTDELLSANLLQQIAFTHSSKKTPADATLVNVDADSDGDTVALLAAINNAASNATSNVNSNATDTKPVLHNQPVTKTDAKQIDLEQDLMTTIITKPVKLDSDKAELADLTFLDKKNTAKADDSQTNAENPVIKTVNKNGIAFTNEVLTEQEASAALQQKTGEKLVNAADLTGNATSTQPAMGKFSNRFIKPDTEPQFVEVLDKPEAKLHRQQQAEKFNGLNQLDTELETESLVVTQKMTNLADKSDTKPAFSQQPWLVTDEPEPQLVLPQQALPVTALASEKAQANSAIAAAIAGSVNKAESKTEGKAEKVAGQQSEQQAKLNMAQTLTDAPTKQGDAAAQLAEKLTPIHNGMPRSEQSFSAVLANAQTTIESRSAAVINNATPTTFHAEQLKQSINLMQQDAAGQMRQQVSLMLSQQIQKAEIRLDPAGLGMMQIKIDMQQDQATVQFTVQQHQAKELIEQQLPRLREMLQQQGIQLAEGQVQQQSQQQQQQRQLAQQGQENQHLAGENPNDEPLGMPIMVTVQQSERLVDYYA